MYIVNFFRANSIRGKCNMCETNDDVCFQCIQFDTNTRDDKIVCLIPQSGRSDYDLCFAFSHRGFLDEMAKHGYLPFTPGNLDDVIAGAKKWVPENVEHIYISQDIEKESKDASILHMIDRKNDFSFPMYCDTKLPFPLHRNCAVLLRIKK